MAARKRTKRTVVGADASAPADPLWLAWYNVQASDAEQKKFDRIASLIDNKSAEILSSPGGLQGYLDRGYANTSLYAPLLSYQSSGGRRALFSPAKDFGKTPISVIRAGGPIEQAPGGVVLHPGRYSYSAVNKDMATFESWVAAQEKNDVTIGQRQVSEGTTPVVGTPYYQDYEFTVTTDVAWPASVGVAPLPGLPTWVPPGVNITDYWGKVTTSSPDWDWLEQREKEVQELVKGILVVGALVGTAWLLSTLRPRTISRSES